ncbi:DUF6786 family protein [Chitinophaga sp.]|uniref:DUF6786 family protein n=1 Tax=Chitinophaga sp. TaxID=1869181 RepID=UPI00262C4E2D|nr:DUF6786 family protein [uncultured Chitinophaga sp.]
MHKSIPAACLLTLFFACNNNSQQAKAPVQQEQTISRPDNFAADIDFLRAFTSPAVLKDSTSKSAIAIVAGWQGRVMSSTVADDGRSFGFLNYGTIENGKQFHFSTFGGEDRLLFGPLPDSTALVPNDSLPATPLPDPLRDSVLLRQVPSAKGVITLEGDALLPNSKNNPLNAHITRTITLLSRRDLHNYLGADIHRSVHAVGFHSDNILLNTGTQRWDTSHGTTAIRIRGMFAAGPQSVGIIPLRKGGKVHTGTEIPKERFLVKNNVAFFRADGNFEMELGVQQASALNFMGIYDPERKLLTVIQFTLPRNPALYLGATATDTRAEVLTIRNNGPENTVARGRFVEVQSTSPAALLKPKGRMQHFHRTIHLEGSEKHLGDITKKIFGVNLKEITTALP